MNGPALQPRRKIGPLFDSKYFRDVKDPCITYDGKTWHIYGSGGSTVTEVWRILHATAPDIEGPWTEQEPALLRGVEGPHVAAPSVFYDADDKLFHMALQQDFMEVGGGIEYLVSADGHIFTKMRPIVKPHGLDEAGLYDPQFARVGGKKYLVYSGVPNFQIIGRAFVPQPDVYLAKSATDRWAGPWRRMQRILSHEDIAWHHNKREHPDYEWGIEGPDLIGLKDGHVILNATCFIEEGPRGTRQRVFFAVAKDIKGPYTSIGPVLTSREQAWESGENGHASAWVKDDELYLFYQARPAPSDAQENVWRYGIAVFSTEDILKAAQIDQTDQSLFD